MLVEEEKSPEQSEPIYYVEQDHQPLDLNTHKNNQVHEIIQETETYVPELRTDFLPQTLSDVSLINILSNGNRQVIFETDSEPS